ncbi:MAG: hypothetical protein C0502_03595 [Opitutus sp.]|nr:hypothetical protein [Opitutus sp.]
MPVTTKQPLCVIIAGPNGAGETTFAREFLPHEGGILNFVNADLIAAGLSPLQPTNASLSAADVRRRFVRSWRNFQEVYRDPCDAWWLYDANGYPPTLLDKSA